MLSSEGKWLLWQVVLAIVGRQFEYQLIKLKFQLLFHGEHQWQVGAAIENSSGRYGPQQRKYISSRDSQQWISFVIEGHLGKESMNGSTLGVGTACMDIIRGRERQPMRGASVGETTCNGSSSGQCALVRYHVHFMFMFYTPCCQHRIVVPTLRGEGDKTTNPFRTFIRTSVNPSELFIDNNRPA